MIIEDYILLKHISNTASASETEMVEAWIQESLHNRKHYQRLLTVHFHSNHLKSYKTFDVEEEWNDFLNNKVVFHEPIENSLPHRKIFLYATAASLILISAFLFLINRDTSIVRSTTDQEMAFTLPDNSEVTLFPNSSITYSDDFAESKERKIDLVGKAKFDVVRNTSSPFIVQSSMINTKVLGTVFLVDNYKPKSPAVNVIKGTVSVIEKDKRTNVRILKKGDSVSFENGKFLEVKRAVKVLKKEKPVARVIEKKKEEKKKEPVIAKAPIKAEPKPEPKVEPTPEVPVVQEPTPKKPKLSAYPVNEALKFLTNQHENFSKSRKAKMKKQDIVMLNLTMSLDDILAEFKKQYTLELEEGKCDGCLKLKKISKK